MIPIAQRPEMPAEHFKAIYAKWKEHRESELSSEDIDDILNMIFEAAMAKDLDPALMRLREVMEKWGDSHPDSTITKTALEEYKDKARPFHDLLDGRTLPDKEPDGYSSNYRRRYRAWLLLERVLGVGWEKKA